MQTLKISHKLAKKGHDITLLCAANTPLEREARKLNLRTVPLLKNDLQIITAIHNIGKLLRSESFEVAHSHLSHDLWSLVPAMHLQKSKSRLVLTKRMASNVNKKDIFHRYLHSRLDKVLTISAYIRNN
ncbi:glycosyltransferase, partial [candidate division KSB1 bacterium]|nr:glycosyltransferase [candidate division KSB1 bacterium]NIT70092.1 glycosyltransferase [candidate division KSB1 bacterium]NIU23728.1 glycosyltransferase [candidate division KSB1 bacterium]NIU93577.1 glycosyltransferase [candidate division KSB1 bacterium]NIW68172.1 glycosyltransferase [candidate division KSB1 bacterium]